MTEGSSVAEYFDALLLGGGQGGTQLAWHLARSGQQVAVIERRWVGGSCPNIACLPSKNEIHSAKIAHLASNAGQFGTSTGCLKIDMEMVRRRKREMVSRDVDAILGLYQETGAELVIGSGRFVSPKTIEVHAECGSVRRMSAEKIFVNVGSHAALPDIPGLNQTAPLTHVEALELDVVPSHLIVLGGGYIGVEMAQAYRRFGSHVTVLQSRSQILADEDHEVANEVEAILEREGVVFLKGSKAIRVTGRSGQAVDVIVETASGERTIEGSHLLVAVGRVPNTKGIGLGACGVEVDGNGFVAVNGRLETTASGVWAIGECAGSPQFTHASNDDYRIIRDNLAGAQRSTSDRLIPYTVFTDPPLARVGLSENEAERRGIAVRVARLPMTSVLRALTTAETQGFMKALVAVDSDQILGFAMIGAEAGEVVSTVQTAMLAKLPYHVLRDAALAHPTMSEGLGPLFETLRSAPA